MKISIIIPVYNEAERLADCLNSIAAQTRMPDEVIVVDNNSIDSSVAIAESFDFVTLLSETKQGVVYARNTGFSAVKGDLIGRIDADTILPVDWVQNAINIMSETDVDAVSGSTHYYDFALPSLANMIDKNLRGWLAQKLNNNLFLWGANMVIRKSAWIQIKSKLCSNHGEHEDLDLALHLQDAGLRVVYKQELLALTSCRRIDMNPMGYFKYVLAGPRTYASHNKKSRIYMYPVIGFCWLVYLPGRLIYRSYDQTKSSWSLFSVIQSRQTRADPTFLDY